MNELDDYILWAEQFPRIRQKSRLLWAAILREFDLQRPPMTVRQMFYRMSAASIVDKSESGYRRTQNALKEMRERGLIPYDYIADNTRWVRRPKTYSDLEFALFEMQYSYRRSLWHSQNVHIEIWLEKDALAGVIETITNEFDVPLCVTRGYPSMTYLHDAAEHLKSIRKPKIIYHFGDYDASGQDAMRSIRDGLQSHGAEFDFIPAAVTLEQINDMQLPTRPAKKSDPRSKNHGDIAVELDSIPPDDLRGMVRGCIEQHIDTHAWEQTLEIQRRERERLQDICSSTKF